MTLIADEDFVVHLSPVRRERANFIINASIEEEGLPRRYEQLWARQLGDTHFEICCTPSSSTTWRSAMSSKPPPTASVRTCSIES